MNLKRPDPESGVLPLNYTPIEAKKYMVSAKKGKDLDYVETFSVRMEVWPEKQVIAVTQ